MHLLPFSGETLFVLSGDLRANYGHADSFSHGVPIRRLAAIELCEKRAPSRRGDATPVSCLGPLRKNSEAPLPLFISDRAARHLFKHREQSIGVQGFGTLEQRQCRFGLITLCQKHAAPACSGPSASWRVKAMLELEGLL